MDLEIIGKQILESLAVQGQIAGLEAKLAGLKEQITRADADIEKTKKEKTYTLHARKQAENELAEAINDEELARHLVAEAGAKLKSAKSSVVEAKEVASKYGDDALNKLDEVSEHLEETKRAIETNRDEVILELNATKENLEARRTELKAQGIELNIGSTRQPKVMVL